MLWSLQCLQVSADDLKRIKELEADIEREELTLKELKGQVGKCLNTWLSRSG